MILQRKSCMPIVWMIMVFGLNIISSTSAISKDEEDKNFPVTTLHNGLQFPLIGLGCASGVDKKAVTSALDSGYRHLDTAQAYVWGYREHDVGIAVKESNIPRNEIFIQSKIHPQDLGYKATKEAFKLSLERLQTDYLDSMLIHKPRCWDCKVQPEGTWKDSWKALEELYDAGLVRAIGICDVDDDLLNELLKQRIKPHIIQNWMDPFHQDKHIRQRCKEEGIQYQAYSTLGTQWKYHKNMKENPVVTNPMLKAISQKYGVDIAQIVINWAVHNGVAVIPASKNPTRQRNNLDSFHFELTDYEINTINEMDGKPEVDSGSYKISMTFENDGNSIISSFFVDDSNNEILIGDIPPKDTIVMNAFHGHRLIFKEASSGLIVGEHKVEKAAGSDQYHVVGARSEL